MANTATRDSLTTRILDLADMTGSAFAVEARVNELINGALSEIHDMLVNAFGEHYVLSTATISLVVGTEAYSLPSVFLKLLKVWYASGDRRYRVPRANLDEIDGLKLGPQSSGSLQVWYAPQFAAPATDGTVISSAIPQGWEDFVVYDGVAKLLAKEESDTTVWIGERERARQRIMDAATPRDVGECLAVSDVSRRFVSRRDWLEDDNTTMSYVVTGNQIRIYDGSYYGT